MKASTHQCWLAIILPKAYENSTQIWETMGHQMATESQQEAFHSMKRYVLLPRDLYLWDQTSLED